MRPNREYKGHRMGISFPYSYRTDGNGWRQVLANTPNRKNFIIILGGSNTFGAGVADGETLADNLARRFLDSQVYNLARLGWGPAHALAVMTHMDLRNRVHQGNGLVILSYDSGHIGRIYPNTNTLAWQKGLAPHFVIEDGQLVQRGTFRSELPMLTKVLTFLGGKFPKWMFPKVTDSTRELMC